MQILHAKTRLVYRIWILFAVCMLFCIIPVVSSLEANDTENLNPATNISSNSTIQETVTENSRIVNNTEEPTPTMTVSSNPIIQETVTENQATEKTLPSHQRLNIDSTGKYVKGQVIVRYKPDVVKNKVLYQAATKTANQKINPRQIEELGSKSVPGVQFIDLPSNMSVAEAIAIYSQDSTVLWVQPNYVYRLTNEPNDPLYNQQWWLNNTGQSVNGQPSGTPGDDIQVSEAWDTFTGPVGSNDVIVAIVDTGIDYTHPDLQNNIWTNDGEMGIDSQDRDKRFNGIDDDGDGIVDDWHGWNTVDRTGNITDVDGHGTSMAGIIGATGNNGIGVSGINWRVKIVPVKIFNEYGSATDYWIMQGMTRAVEEANAKIISNSWAGGDSPDHYVRDFITNNPDVLFVAAAGNCNPDPTKPCSCNYSINRDNDDPNNSCRAFPASYTSNNIISVASSDQNDNLAYHSHFGATSVDLVAPGTNISTTNLTSSGINYHFVDGTSPATAVVSGVAALIKSINPSASVTTIRNAILQNVDQKISLSGLVQTGGRLNAKKALDSVSVMVPPMPDFTADVTSGQDPLTVHFTDNSVGARINSWSWNFGDGGSSYLPNPTHTYNAGTYTVSLTLSNGYSNTTTKTNYITVSALPAVFYIVPSFNSAQGSINPPSIQSVQYGSSQSFMITPGTGYQIDDVIVSGVSQGAITNYTFTNVQANSTISATFKPASLTASFTATPTNGTAPLTVQFNDTSSGSPTNWNWSFGDGSYSVIQHVNHTYVQAGNYDVSLSVSNSSESNTTIIQNFITVMMTGSIPTISSITPATGINTGIVPITDLAGTNFTTGSTVALVNPSPVHKGNITYGMNNVTMDIPTDVFVSGNYAYVISEEVAGLEIIDVSDPTNPIHKGSISDGSGGAHLSGLYDLHVLGNYAYLPDFYNNALEIVDVSDPANPVHKSSITNGTGGALLNRAWGVYVSGNYAYVASQWSNALEIVDISNPANPVHKGSIINGSGGARLNNPYDVYVSGNYAYVVSTGSNSLEIVNVSDPANPVHKGSIVNGAGGALLATPTDLYVSGNYAYVVSTGSNALEIVDISDPANPVHKASITNGTGGAILYAADSISVSNNNAYITSYSGSSLEVVDISDPSNPVHKVSMIDGMQGAIMRNPYGNDVSGDYVYATTLNNAGTLEILEIGTSIPATNVTVVSPTSISCKFDLSNAIVGPYDVVVTDTTGRVGSLANGFTIISDPSTPLTVSSIVPATGINTTTVSITTLSGTNFKSNATVLLTPVNSNPIHKGSITYGTGDALLEWPESVYVSGNYAYIASHDSWALEIVNISNPASPVHTSSIIAGTGGANLQCPNSVYVSGSNAYVACDCGNALEVVDISNPTSPTHKGSITDGTGGALLAGADNVYVSGNYAYITSPGDNALEIIDVSNPANPTHKGSIVDGTNGALLYQPHSVYVSGDYAYIASYGSNALEIVNISNPANPTHEGSISNGMDGALLNSPNSVYVSGDYAYIASYGSNALEIVNISNPANPTHRGSIVDGTNGALLYQPHSVYVSGDRAYVASYGSNALEIIDISNPASPAHKSSLLNGTGDAILLQPYSVFVYGDNAYVINVGRESLEIVDIGTIHATNATVVSSTQITGMFNLTNRISGPYNVVVTNTDGQTGILKNGFTVTSS